MKKLALVSAVALSLTACNGVTIANNTLADLAKNKIPLACGIISTAEGYYSQIVGAPLPGSRVANAEAGVKIICDNPPTDLAAAFATLLSEWTIIQSATVKP